MGHRATEFSMYVITECTKYTKKAENNSQLMFGILEKLLKSDMMTGT